jgi:hypothetical protein
MLVTHAHNFQLPLPEVLQPNSNSPVVPDTETQREAMLKMIELMLHQVNDIRRILDDRSAMAELQSRATEDGRYFSSASRELERAVAWHRELVEGVMIS